MVKFMTLDYKKIGNRIRQARLKMNISQKDLAGLTNFSLTHIKNIESGNTKLSLPALIQISNALSITADEILCDNIKEVTAPFKNEINDILSDCDGYQLKVISATIKTLKENL